MKHKVVSGSSDEAGLQSMTYDIREGLRIKGILKDLGIG